MKKLMSALVLTALLASPSFAAKAKRKKVVKTTTTTTTTTTPAVETTTTPVSTTASSSSYPAHHASSSTPELSLDLGLGTLIEKFHFGVGFKVQWPMDIEGNDFKFGAQTGFYFGPSTPTSFVIPILATAEYDFRVANNLKPYLGLGMGISIAHASAYGMGATSTDFAFLFTPGLNFNDGKNFVEVPIGTMNTSFAIIPSVGMHF